MLSIEDMVGKEPRGHRFIAPEKKEERTRVSSRSIPPDVEQTLRSLSLRMQKLEERISAIEESLRRKK